MSAAPATTPSVALAPTDDGARLIPAVVPPRPLDPLDVRERTLSAGLRVLAVARPGIPVVELRLRVPFAGGADDRLAERTLLTETLLTGTASRDRLRLATDLQSLGGGLSASADADRLAVVGSVLAPNLTDLLGIIAEVVTGASYPADEVAGERERIVAELGIARSQPSLLAREALLARLYGAHPYAREVPTPEQQASVSADEVRALHSARVVPSGAVLTLVGDLDAEAALDAVEAALSGWAGASGAGVPPLPAHQPGRVRIVDRPGAVQTNIRLGGPALARDDPRYSALQVANTIFGGYFSSRLVLNIREGKGYTYSPRSGIEHALAGSRLTVGADVATEVSAPALLEIGYELGRIGVLPVSSEELEGARQYAVGSLALSTATSAGLASTLSMLAGAGLGPEYLIEHPAALARVTAAEVQELAAEFLAPSALTSVLLGDAARISGPVSVLSALDEQ